MVDFNTAYCEAVERETDIRDTSFTPEIPWNVAGVPLRWLTPLDYKVLDDAGNLVLIESLPVEQIPFEHVAAFFWFLRVGHDPTRVGFVHRVAQRLFARQVFARRIEYANAAREYLIDNMQDRPPTQDGECGALTASWLAILCDQIAHEYGWDDDAITRKPLARLFQYLKRINERADPNAPRFNPSDETKNILLRR